MWPDTKLAPFPSRRLSDKILVAFHHACDQADFEVAERLIRILEIIGSRTTSAFDRRQKESFVHAHRRLWELRHPESYDHSALELLDAADG